MQHRRHEKSHAFTGANGHAKQFFVGSFRNTMMFYNRRYCLTIMTQFNNNNNSNSMPFTFASFTMIWRAHLPHRATLERPNNEQ